MPAPALALGPLGQIAMPVRDPARGLAFHRDILRDHPGSILYFKVPDVVAAHAELSGRGVRFKDAPHRIARLPDHELWMTFFEDSEGNTLALMAEVPFGGAAA